MTRVVPPHQYQSGSAMHRGLLPRGRSPTASWTQTTLDSRTQLRVRGDVPAGAGSHVLLYNFRVIECAAMEKSRPGLRRESSSTMGLLTTRDLSCRCVKSACHTAVQCCLHRTAPFPHVFVAVGCWRRYVDARRPGDAGAHTDGPSDPNFVPDTEDEELAMAQAASAKEHAKAAAVVPPVSLQSFGAGAGAGAGAGSVDQQGTRKRRQRRGSLLPGGNVEADAGKVAPEMLAPTARTRYVERVLCLWLRLRSRSVAWPGSRAGLKKRQR